MNEYILLGLLISLTTLAAAVVGRNVAVLLLKTLLIRRNNKRFAKLEENRKKILAEEGYHDWVTIETLHGDITVCQKTGWCPSRETFISVAQIPILQNLCVKEKELISVAAANNGIEHEKALGFLKEVLKNGDLRGKL